MTDAILADNINCCLSKHVTLKIKPKCTPATYNELSEILNNTCHRNVDNSRVKGKLPGSFASYPAENWGGGGGGNDKSDATFRGIILCFYPVQMVHYLNGSLFAGSLHGCSEYHSFLCLILFS